MRYLVTGGSGFCGFEIVKFLIKKGHKVRVIDIEPLPESIKGVEFFKVDIRNREEVLKACKDVDLIIHTIAKVPISKAGREFFNVNVGGTRNILDAAHRMKIRKVVHLSSSSVQYPNKNPVNESDPIQPTGEYATSKAKAENVCEHYRRLGLDVDIIRPRTVIGMGRLGIFDILFDWISSGKKIYIIGNGRNKIQFIHTLDLANICYLSSLKKGSFTFNVGSREFESLREDLEYVISLSGKRSKVVGLPVHISIFLLKSLDILNLSPLTAWHYMTYHIDFYFDNKYPLKILKWSPKYSNKEILKEAYLSYLSDKDKPLGKFGTSHRKHLKQGILGLLKKVS